jgi:hypothetical protein
MARTSPFESNPAGHVSRWSTTLPTLSYRVGQLSRRPLNARRLLVVGDLRTHTGTEACQRALEYALGDQAVDGIPHKPGGIPYRCTACESVQCEVAAASRDRGPAGGPTHASADRRQPGRGRVPVAPMVDLEVAAQVLVGATTPLVSREPDPGTRRAWDQAVREQLDADLTTPILEVSSTTAIKAAVMGGSGSAVLSVRAVTAELAVRTLSGLARDLLTIALRSAVGQPHCRNSGGNTVCHYPLLLRIAADPATASVAAG